MHQITACCFIFLFLCNISQAQTACMEVRTGTFHFFNKSYGKTLIKRNKKHHIETNKQANYKAKFDVSWVDSCTYELSNKEIIRGPESLQSKPGYIVKVNILWIEGDSMKVKTTSNMSDLEVETLIKIGK
ncbi:MAG: hypothetical protein AAGI38_24650 [Bacteroidota bacterium]